jgi:choline dehydrogenase-like flavoprotein
MLVNLNEVPAKIDRKEYDVCIAGAGFAGISLALKLETYGFDVLLLEGGDIEYSDESQAVYEGQNIGMSYFDLDAARLRYLGGTSNHWAGWSRPLDEWDFAEHDHIPDSGWPITKSELDPYLGAASEFLEIDVEYPDSLLENSKGLLKKIHFEVKPPVRLGEKYHDYLKQSDKIDLFINANLVDIKLTDSTQAVSAFECANFANPATKFNFSAKFFVLAMGGLEIPRLMLNFTHQNPHGIGNSNDLVGRYFMEHFHAFGGWYVTEKGKWPFDEKESHLAPTPQFLNEQKIANAGIRIGSYSVADDKTLYEQVKQVICEQDLIRTFVSNFRNINCVVGSQPDSGGPILIASEQVPNRNSRVSLSDSLDKFGHRRAVLDWQITELDRDTIKRSTIGFGQYFAEQDYGNVKLIDWMLDDTTAVPGVDEDLWLGAGWHHMGTTRMSDTSATGVVDKNCRVFDTENLFIAGSSVFPTGGHANPTLTLVQLSLKLGDHLKEKLQSS